MSKDLECISFPHDDALVISEILANFEVKMILIYNESATNILSHETFTKIGNLAEQLKAVKPHLLGFGDGVIIPKGVIELLLTLLFSKRQVTKITSFQVVRASKACNTILGRLLLNKIKLLYPPSTLL